MILIDRSYRIFSPAIGQGNKVDRYMSIGFDSFRRQGFISRLFRGIPLLGFLFLFSCEKKEELRLAPPPMPPLSREEIGYGVVNVSYTHLADESGGLGLSLGYLRRGSVVRILERRIPAPGGAGGRRPGTLPGAWVLVEGRGAEAAGWLPESVIDVYPSESQARTAAETLLQ
jgi:hypothetical protein